MEHYKGNAEYAVFVFHDRYDVPVKAADKERLGESEEVFEYLICALCPLTGEYEPGNPVCGFLFPIILRYIRRILCIPTENGKRESWDFTSERAKYSKI